MAVPTVLAGSVHELVDLALGEIAAFDCEVFSVWCAAIGYLICHEKSLSRKYDWKHNGFLHSRQFFYLAKKQRKLLRFSLERFLVFRELGPAQGLPTCLGEGADGSRSLCASSTHVRNPAMGPER